LAVVGFIGLTVIFPNFMATSGQDFVGQINTSSGLEKYDDYEVGDTVTIVDIIIRMEYSEGQTQIWLDTIGKAASDPPFRFDSNLMDDYGVGSQVIITFEVVKDSNGHDLPAGYQNEGDGLSEEAISSRYSTVNEYIFIILVAVGLITIIYGGYSSFKGDSSIGVLRPSVVTPQDDWGVQAVAPPVAPAVAPPVAPPMAPPVAPPVAPSMAPPVAPSTEYAQSNPEVSGMSFSASKETSMTIAVPPGVVAGQVLTITMPNGQVVNVQVPTGSYPGSQFTITVKQ
jgi:hypothetical protein